MRLLRNWALSKRHIRIYSTRKSGSLPPLEELKHLEYLRGRVSGEIDTIRP